MIPAFVYYVAAALGAAFFVWAGYGWFAWPSFGGGSAFLLLLELGFLCIAPIVAVNLKAFFSRPTE